MRILHINAARWFQRSYGNTYYAARITDAATDEVLAHIPYAYGYGDSCVDEILDAAIAAGKLPRLERYPNGCREARYQWAERNGIKIITSIYDVPRERDLKRF